MSEVLVDTTVMEKVVTYPTDSKLYLKSLLRPGQQAQAHGVVLRQSYSRTGQRLAVSDVVATIELPEEMRDDPVLYSGCMAGASLIGDLEALLRDAGFERISITPKDESRAFIKDWAPGRGVEDYVVSAYIDAVKPLPVIT